MEIGKFVLVGLLLGCGAVEATPKTTTLDIPYMTITCYTLSGEEEIKPKLVTKLFTSTDKYDECTITWRNND